MRRLPVLLVSGLVAATQATGADTDINALLKSECGEYQNPEVRDQCERRALERDINRGHAELLQASLVKAGHEWMKRFGIDYETDQEADLKFEVARRKGVVFVTVLERCLAHPAAQALQALQEGTEIKGKLQMVADFNQCLVREEKVEFALGNVLTEPPQTDKGSVHTKGP